MPFNNVNEHKPETARTSFKAKKTNAVYGSDAFLMTLQVNKDAADAADDDDDDDDDNSGNNGGDVRHSDGSPPGP